jgi:hypothetical protein
MRSPTTTSPVAMPMRTGCDLVHRGSTDDLVAA